MFRLIIIALATCIGAGCGRIPGIPGGAGGRAPADSIVVDVLNENYYAARIHAIYEGGQRRSIGTIPGNGGQARVALAWEPRSLIFEVLLVTEGSTYLSDPVDVAAGQAIDLRVPSNIRGSGFFRRVP